MRTTSEQIVNLPTSRTVYQSFIGLMAGVAAPYMIQAGGINNPARSMGVSINGQPPHHTLFRIDGATVTNQWYPDLQAYSPAWRPSKRSASSPTVSMPIRGWRAARR